MQFLHFIASLSLGLLPLASANFDLYYTRTTYANPIPGSPLHNDGWQIFTNDPTCDQVINDKFYLAKNDVSGDKVGVRCVGDCQIGGAPEDMTTIEMNFRSGPNPVYHFSKFHLVIGRSGV
jgi:hypothetical protein